MGGQGSGRPPSAETIVKRMSPEQTPVGDSIFLPNYSGIQEAALKTSKPLGTAAATGGGHTIQEEGTPLTQRTNLNFSGSGVIATDYAAGDQTIIHIITATGGGDHAVLSNLDYASAAHTGFASSTQMGVLSGALISLSGSYFTHVGTAVKTHVILESEITSLSGAYATTKGQLTTLSGSVVTLSGANYLDHTKYDNLSGSFWTLSGSNYTEHTAMRTNIASLSGSFLNLSGAYYAHAIDASDPHGAVLTQTGIVSSGAVSGAYMNVTGDYTTFSGAYVANIVFGTGSTPPTAANYPQGTIYVQYTA